jgi:hypothetical protein
VDLNRVVGNPAHQLRAIEFRHGGFFLERALVVSQPAGLVQHVAPAFYFGGAVGQLESDCLKL